MRDGKLRRTVVSITALGALTACGDDLYDTRSVSFFSDGAFFYITDDALIPYSKIKNEMKPGFVLGSSGKDGKSPGDAALGKVLNNTGYYQQQMIRAWSAALNVDFGTTKVNNQTTTKSENGGNPQVTVNNVTTYASGTPPTLEQLKGQQTGMPAGAMKSIDPLQTGDKDRPLDQPDPILAYNLAAALVEEVGLLNHALDYIESESSGTHKTYVLRFRIRVTPVAPNQPYNSFVSVGFFCTAEGNAIPRDFAPPSDAFVKVHPLLVSDDLSTTATARTAQLITQLSVALSGMLGSAGFGGLFSSNTNKIRTLLGKDMDSTLSVARSSDNTIVARLGAPRQPTAGYAMIDRNYAISVILQAPNDCNTLNISSAASLRDAYTGKLVAAPPEPIMQGMRAELQRYLAGYVQNKDAVDAAVRTISNQDMSELASFTRPPQEQKFYQKLESMLTQIAPTIAPAGPDHFTKISLRTWRALWVTLTRELSRSPYQNVSISVYNSDVKSLPARQQPAPQAPPPPARQQFSPNAVKPPALPM